jgi:hypothetical protein
VEWKSLKTRIFVIDCNLYTNQNFFGPMLKIEILNRPTTTMSKRIESEDPEWFCVDVETIFIPKAFFGDSVVGWGFCSNLGLFYGFLSGGLRDAQTRANISILDTGVVKTSKETNTSS